MRCTSNRPIHLAAHAAILALLASAPVHAAPSHTFTANQPDEARAWQQTTRAKIAELLHLESLHAEVKGEAPLAPYTFFESRTDLARVVNTTFRSTKDRTPYAVVTIPHGDGPFPAVICIHGHGANRDSVYSRYSAYQGFAATLAENGFVTISVDVGYHKNANPEVPLTGHRVWDLMRAMELLDQLPVDKERIGCAGLSLGGALTMWLAAVDTRIRAAMVAGWMPTVQHLEEARHCPCWDFPGLRDAIDFPDVFGLIAPRPLMLQLGEADKDFPKSVAEPGVRRVAMIYERFGSPDKLEVVVHPGAHEALPAQTLTFFQRTLGVAPPAASKPDEAEVRTAPEPESYSRLWLIASFGAGLLLAFSIAFLLRRRSNTESK